ncbi:MAG: 2-oxo acid dehydrogenase subunit E2 [Oscillospiraceae bacterium]|jgi:hypothetical protein|nr:2-oxo acid dehydrogenase subunit E2 [Oscillospiraceae bacterium]
MFGRRADGRRLKTVDPILGLTAYLMPQRSDAQVMCMQEVDYDKIAKYIQDQRSNGRSISFMSIIIAAYIRTMCKFPELNRFVVNKQMYARNEIAVSFMVLKNSGDENVEASAVKVKFAPTDTIFQISDRIEKAIEENRNPPKAGNATEQIARTLYNMPFLCNIIVGFLKLLERYGLLPRAIVEASPFHTSLFVTNMASLGINYIYHHIYNFGTTSVFISTGKILRQTSVNSAGESKARRVIPLGVVGDERICNGATYAKVYAYWKKCAENPETLELPPDDVKLEVIGTPEWVKNPR